MILPIPDGAWDSHTHVFGDADRFPARIASAYALPEAPFDLHQSVMAGVGIKRAVLIQPAPYAQDLSCMLDALAQGGGRLRGVATARGDVSDADLQTMDAAGVRGLRFLEARTPAGDRYPGSVELNELSALADRMRGLGWHAEIWSPLDTVLEMWPIAKRAGVPVVIDHLGGFDVDRGADDPAFQTLVAMVREGAVSVKLTLCRRIPFGGDYGLLRPFHDALVEANPMQLIWGSDFPFVRMAEHAPTVAQMLDLFRQWVDDVDLQRTILVDNPSARYAAR